MLPAHPHTHRWTAKEAAYKALYPRMQLSWKDLSVTKDTDGVKPHLIFSVENQARHTFDDPPRLHLSVSHDGDYVISFVVAEASSTPETSAT